ncbi:MAG: thioredoxin family protein [Sedimentisphaerales bacterium]|nr:thioredoxin family protein [Sedimentisphaerales bacterium]
MTRINKREEEFRCAKHDVEQQGNIANKYNIGPIPAYVILNPDGSVINTFIGYHPPDEFIAKLQAAL